MTLELDIPELKKYLRVKIDMTSFHYSGDIQDYDYDDIKSFVVIKFKPINETPEQVIECIKEMYPYNTDTFNDRITIQEGAIRIKVKPGIRGRRDPISFRFTNEEIQTNKTPTNE